MGELSKNLYNEAIQTHHISYDPEITIDILKELHEKFHGHGTGKNNKKEEKEYNAWYLEGNEERFTELWEEGKTYKELMNEFNISFMTVWKWRERFRLKPRGRGWTSPQCKDDELKNILLTIEKEFYLELRKYKDRDELTWRDVLIEWLEFKMYPTQGLSIGTK